MTDLRTITPDELGRLDPASQAQVKAMLQLKQALFDVLGSYPQDNVLPYFYQFSNTSAAGNAIAANATVQQSIKISADAAFVTKSIQGSSTGDFAIFARTDASDRQLMNQAVHSSAILGTAERPGMLHKPLLLPANTTISFDVTDLSGAVNEVYFAMCGFKVYNRKVQ